MQNFEKTEYYLKSVCCGTEFNDGNWELNCPKNISPSLIRTVYTQKQLRIRDLPGLYCFADWLPINRILGGSGKPITYKSEGLAKKLGLKNLYINFNGYWPEKGAFVKTGTFKEFEAYSVCARINPTPHKTLVVASAGNTARAFAHVCSENKIPLLLFVPYDYLDTLWFEKPLNQCVKIVSIESGSDYYDAIHFSNYAIEMPDFYPEGGAKNVARRDGMGLSVLSAVTTIGKIPDYYFQAIGSGTGAISAWEANLRFIEDGRYGNNKMKLMVSQNYPFIPIKEAWDAKSRDMLPMNEEIARKNVEAINAKVLSNRKPPYSLIGGLFDALSDTNGEVLAATNYEAQSAAELFEKTEGIDIDIAASVAVASLIDSVKNHKVEKNAVIMLNITGGGIDRYMQTHELHYAQPHHVFKLTDSKEFVKAKISELFK
ncbi:MAG: cysteate synthase [Prolixibacteraceae bacterium]|nr:cysteate synthase [Prolixibacteraceae bacterium]